MQIAVDLANQQLLRDRTIVGALIKAVRQRCIMDYKILYPVAGFDLVDGLQCVLEIGQKHWPATASA